MMSIIMNSIVNDSKKDEEVKRLQELVRKLETQNQELRTERQAIICDNEVKTQKNKEKSITDILNHENVCVSQLNNDHVEHLVDELDNLDDEENWLFESPKSKSSNKDWLKQDVEDPSLHYIKRSLVKKLDEITNSPQISPKHSVYSPSSSSIASPESPPSTVRGGHFDSRTFIRTKKRQSLLDNKQTFQENLSTRNREGQLTGYQTLRSREYLGQSSGSLASEEDDRLSSASDGSYTSYRLADVEDVNTVARMQEESLKLPEPKPLNRLTGVRTGYGMSGRIPTPKPATSDGSAGSSQEDLIANTRKTDVPRTGLQPPRRYYSNMPSSTSRESSDLSSPTESPYNSRLHLESYSGRRYGNSDLRLADSDSPSFSKGPHPPARTSRLQANQRTSRLSAPSPVRLPGGPPQLTELPRSEVARARQSVIQKPRLKTPQKMLPNSYQNNDWREGCY